MSYGQGDGSGALGREWANKSPNLSRPAQAIGDQAPRFVLKPSQQTFEETLGSCSISAILHEDVEPDAVLVDRAPEIVLHAFDPQERRLPSTVIVRTSSDGRCWRCEPADMSVVIKLP
jgi:hypothetical protein